MHKLIITRWYLKDCTVGMLKYKDFHAFTLELPWLDNQRNISCIPAAGGYVGRKHKSPANGDCIAIDNVKDRTYIQIHAANYVRQLAGCIAVGDSICYIDRDGVPDVSNSKNSLKALLEVLPDKFTVDIS